MARNRVITLRYVNALLRYVNALLLYVNAIVNSIIAQFTLARHGDLGVADLTLVMEIRVRF